MNRYVTVRAPAPRARALFSALTLLTMCSFAALTADTAEAQFITVNSVTDFVRIKDSSIAVPFDNTSSNFNVLGNDLNQIIGTGSSETDGYRSRQITNTSGSSLNLAWQVDIPSPGSLGPAALGQGNSTITFTATSDSVYTAAGDNFFGNGNINTLFNYKLRDETAAMDLVSFSDGWINSNGTQVNTTTGSLTGTLIAGRLYSWTSDYEASKYGFAPNQSFTASGNASLNLTAIAVPEPSTFVLLGLAALGMFTWRRVR